MAAGTGDDFIIYKGQTVAVPKGKSPLTITGCPTGVKVTAGTYEAVRVVGGVESARVSIPEFTPA